MILAQFEFGLVRDFLEILKQISPVNDFDNDLA